MWHSFAARRGPKRGSMEIRWSEARLRKVEWVSERGIWISLCEIGEVNVASVGSDGSAVDSRFFPYIELDLTTVEEGVFAGDWIGSVPQGDGHHPRRAQRTKRR